MQQRAITRFCFIGMRSGNVGDHLLAIDALWIRWLEVILKLAP
jgi:hypothetical protein